MKSPGTIRSGLPLATLVTLSVMVVLAGVVRFLGLDFGLPHTQARPDETHIIETLRALLSGRVPPFYDYPWVYMWLLTPLYVAYYLVGAATGTFSSLADMVASWPLHWEPFFLFSRGLSATMGTLTIVAVFALGRRLWDDITGLTAAFFLAFAFLHVRDSHFGTTDVTMTLFIVASIGLLVDAHRSPSRRRFAVAGLVAGLAAGTKYSAAPLVVPFVASYVLNIATSSNRRAAMRDPRLLIAASGFAVGLAIGLPFVFFDTSVFLAAMGRLVESMQDGTPQIDVGNGWMQHLAVSLRFGLGAPLLIAGLLGMAVIIAREPQVAVLVLSFPVAYFAVAGGMRYVFVRYAIPIIPFLCLAAARLICRAATSGADAARMRTGRLAHPSAALAAVSAAAVLLALPSIVNTVRWNRVITQTDNRVEVARWFAENVPPGSSLLQSGSRYGHVQFDRRVPYTHWVWDGAYGVFRVGRAVAVGRPDWILVQESPLPSATQEIVKEFLADAYDRVTEFQAVDLRADLVYDTQDAFFVPISGLEHVTRPGPNFVLFRRQAGSADR